MPPTLRPTRGGFEVGIDDFLDNFEVDLLLQMLIWKRTCVSLCSVTMTRNEPMAGMTRTSNGKLSRSCMYSMQTVVEISAYRTPTNKSSDRLLRLPYEVTTRSSLVTEQAPS